MELSPMMRQIESVPALMTELLPALRQKAAALAADPRLQEAKKLVLVGCGDSYCAALAARPAFAELTGLDAEVSYAIDVARCLSRRALTRHPGTVYVFISNSGAVSRMVEAAQRITGMGGTVLAVTGSERSPLYGVSSLALTMEIPRLCGGPGMRSYAASVMALYALAVELAREDEDRARAEALWQQLLALPPVLEGMMPLWQQQAAALAPKLASARAFEFIGTAGDYANSFFAYAKELETIGLPASAHNTEDWLHMNYFILDVEGTATFQFVRHKEGGYSRSCELRDVAAEMGRPLVVLTDEPEEAQPSERPWRMSLPAGTEPLLDPLTGYLPVSLAVGHLAQLLGGEDFRGTRDHWTACIDFATVAKSRQIILD